LDERVERDESCNHTTCHASIVCKCGKKVCYGCGKNQHTRPIFCKSCTKIELKKLRDNSKMIGEKTDEQIIMYYLRRGISHE